MVFADAGDGHCDVGVTNGVYDRVVHHASGEIRWRKDAEGCFWVERLDRARDRELASDGNGFGRFRLM